MNRFSANSTILAAAMAVAIIGQAAAAAPAWRLDPSGFGPLKIRMSFDQVRKLAPRLKATPPGLLASQSCDQLALPGHPGAALMFVDGTLTRIDLFRPGPRTTRGIQAGDRVARTMQAYPGLRAEPNKYDENERYLTERSGDGAIRFETRKGRIANIYAGRWAQVQYIEGCL
jgi:hypothetical protein